MRRRIIILLIFLIPLIIGVALRSSRSASDVQQAIKLKFTDQEPGPPFRAAGFDLINPGPKSIFVFQVWAQIHENGAWTNVSGGVIQFSPCLAPGRTNINLSPIWEPGDSRKIIVEWPQEAPWRIAVVYATEATGVSGLFSEVGMVLKSRRFGDIGKSGWIDSPVLVSEPILK